MSGPAQQALRGVGAGRVFVGLVTLLAASRGDVAVFDSLPPRATVAARLLAVRDLVQGAALVLTPESRVADAAALGSTVDGLHAASMLPLVAFSSRYRHAATLSGMSALAWLAVTALAQRACNGTPSGHQSRLLRRNRIQR